MARFEDDPQERKEIDVLLTLVCFLIFGAAIVAVVQELYPNLIQGSKTMIGVLLIVPLLAFLVVTPDQHPRLTSTGSAHRS